MSVSVMSEVFKRYPNGDGEMLLALAIADHADDRGEHIWPSIGSLAKKTRQSERSVQRQLRKMEADGWLIRVSVKKIGRGQTVEYRINPDWLKGDILSPFQDEKRVTSEPERVTPATQKGDIGDIAYKEEPSVKPSMKPSAARASEITLDQERKRFTVSEGLYDRWLETYRRQVDPERWSLEKTEAWLETEMAKAENWLFDAGHPKRVKSYRDWKKFMTGWLERSLAPRPPPSAVFGRKAAHSARAG